MPYQFTEKFEPDNGFRLFRDKTSVLAQALSYGRRLSPQNNLQLAQRLDAFFKTIAKRVEDRPGEAIKAPTTSDLPLSKADFTEVTPDGAIYKYVDDKTWNYLQTGSFKFGSADYYRKVENPKIRDEREGIGHFHLTSDDNQLNVSLNSGDNCAIYCATSRIDGENDALMRDRFGRKRIKIEPVGEFMERARKLVGAYRARIFDVAYRDMKSYSEDFAGIERIFEITGKRDLTEKALHTINKEFFTTFYEFGLMSGLYCKPTSFSDEAERRIIFETRKDIRKPVFKEDKTLLSFVTFLGE